MEERDKNKESEDNYKMIPIKEDLISVGKNRPAFLLRPQKIIIHRTGNSGASAKNNRDYFESLNHPPLAGKTFASAHYLVDATNIIRCIPENEQAYHCVGANRDAIGIETCEPITKEIYQNVLDLIVDIILRYKFKPTPDYLQPHSRYDPLNRPFDPFCWIDFSNGKTNPKNDLFDPNAFYADVKSQFIRQGEKLS
ncbi:MAG TPA: hypothetical protein DDW50_20935 [Firmicutes bacterium]|nr:hypothetical protein [Bacillota bacterium]